MIAAIDIYNKPDFRYRAESFTILALNSWELLLKAKWLADHENKISSLYVRESGGNRAKYKRTRSGTPMTVAFDYLSKKLTELRVIKEACRKNLEALTELRDISVHLYHHNPRFEENVLEIGMGCLKNYVSAVQDWFSTDLSVHNFYLMPLSFVSAPSAIQAVALNRAEDGFIRYVKGLIDHDADPSDRYAVAINLDIRFIKSNIVSGTPVRRTNDPTAVPVVMTEEQIRDTYPWDYHELTNRCKVRYSNFVANQAYHIARKALENNTQCARVRRLDPANPNSMSKTFYAPAMLEELDKVYTPRAR
jgi:hypothetical protein